LSIQRQHVSKYFELHPPFIDLLPCKGNDAINPNLGNYEALKLLHQLKFNRIVGIAGTIQVKLTDKIQLSLFLEVPENSISIVNVGNYFYHLGLIFDFLKFLFEVREAIPKRPKAYHICFKNVQRLFIKIFNVLNLYFREQLLLDDEEPVDSKRI
jgi:hypothetical protein